MNPVRIFIISIISISFLFAVYILVRLDEDGREIEETEFLMGTIVEIKMPASSSLLEKAHREAIKKAFSEIARVEAVFSVFKPDSEISKINRLKPGEVLKIDDEVFGLIESAIEYSKKTNGAFDITVKPLVDLWASSKITKLVPSENDIRETLSKVGSENIILDKTNRTISFKKDGMALDLGGVAKGYATDRAIKVLRGNNVAAAVVNSGGDMYCLGRRPKKSSWRVGIQHPRKRDRLLFEMDLQDKAVDTSGDYEKYFELDGKRYSHIINPITGYPVGGEVVSATVIADDSATADMLATALCILGPEGLKVVDGVRGAGAILVFKDGDILKTMMSEGLKDRYNVTQKKEP